MALATVYRNRAIVTATGFGVLIGLLWLNNATPRRTALGEEPVAVNKEQAAPAAKRVRPAKGEDEPFDPVKVNGEIFVGWAKPKVALLITGMERGYIEPCGCAGLDRMKGGMARRYSLFKDLRDRGWPVVGLDVGGISQGFGPQAEMKLQVMLDGKREMDYSAIALGTDELQLAPQMLLGEAAGTTPLVSADVVLDRDLALPATMRVIDAGGMKIGVTAILGKEYQKAIRDGDITMSDPEAAIKKILPELQKQRPDYLVLLAHAKKNESIALAKMFPAFHVVVTSDGFAEPPNAKEMVGKTLLIQVGQKGMDAVVLGLFDDKDKSPRYSTRYEVVPLDSRFATAPKMKLLMAQYQENLKDVGFAGLGLNAVPHPLKENGRFVGSKKCASCHEISYDIWKKSFHAEAYDTLTKADPPRNFDPECVSCHVTGWHPTKFFPYESGFECPEKTPQLLHVGCENCHGPGEKHVAVEMSGSELERQELRKAMRLTRAEAEKQQCITCHDLDNSPKFDFKTYWPLIEHKEGE